MKVFLRNCLVTIMTSLSLSAIAGPCDDGGIGGTGIALSRGIGGTGLTPESGGIGGTGISNIEKGIGGTGIQTPQSGIGGTGIQAENGLGGTGVIGVITGFASICVNGLEVHFYNDTPVDLDGKKISSQDLAVGHVVAVQAYGKGQSLVAHNIHAYHQITGPITALNAPKGKLSVMGQSVTINAAQLKGMQIGQWVDVSGLRKADGSVIASRIDQTKGQKIAQTVGNLTRQGNKLYLAGTRIEGLPKTTGNANVDTSLTGTWNGRSLNVKDMAKGPVSDLLQKVEAFHLQGIASGDILNGRLKLAGQHVDVTSQTKVTGKTTENSLAGKAVIVRGQMKEGKPNAQSIELQAVKTEHDHDAKTAPDNAKQSVETAEKTSSKESDSRESSGSATVDKPMEAKGSEKNKDDQKHIKVEKAEKLEKAEKIEKTEKVEKAEKLEKVEKIEKAEKVEKPEKVEKIEKIEKVEKVEKPESHEKIEKRDKIDR